MSSENRVYKIGLIRGDGIGPEIVGEAVKVLDRAGELFGFRLEYTELYLGGSSIDRFGVPLTDETVEKASRSDAVLMGSIGGDPKTSPWYQLEPSKRPEAGLLGIRKALGLFANLRFSKLYPDLSDSCPLKESISAEGIDFVILRELTGGLYFGDHRTDVVNGEACATDVLSYSETEIRRIAVKAFDTAMLRSKKMLLVDKANVLESSRLWRKVVQEVAADYPEVSLDFMYVDNAAMQLIRRPSQFDVVLTENMFGDILSDEASMITGSIGMQPSASLAEGTFGLYEPSHGSAPDIAGKDLANPLATILSGAMMLRYSLGEEAAACAIERSVEEVVKRYRTPDLATEDPGIEMVGCVRMGSLVADNLAGGNQDEK